MTRKGNFGWFTCDDGESRPFDPGSTDPRVILATVLAGRDGWAEIRPGHWRDAGALVRALRAAGQLVDRRTIPRPFGQPACDMPTRSNESTDNGRTVEGSPARGDQKQGPGHATGPRWAAEGRSRNAATLGLRASRQSDQEVNPLGAE